MAHITMPAAAIVVQMVMGAPLVREKTWNLASGTKVKGHGQDWPPTSR